VGLFQSLAWMANPRGLVVAFDRSRARDCRDCATPKSTAGAACDQVCPMRLKPRNIKRLMFSCVQCGQCLTACDTSNTARAQAPSLEWHIGLDAVRETLKQRRT
jgi:polyferredoxin